jgi:hypothetical protein
MKICPGLRTGSPTPKLASTLQALGSTIHKTILATFKFSTAEDQASTLDLNGSESAQISAVRILANAGGALPESQVMPQHQSGLHFLEE